MPTPLADRLSRSNPSWFRKLPLLIETLCRSYDLDKLELTPHPGVNLVIFAQSSGSPVVIKLVPPGQQLDREITATNLLAKSGFAPDQIACDAAEGWSVSERLLPGISLQQMCQTDNISDGDATRIAALLMLQLSTTYTETTRLPFPHLREWAHSLFRYADSGDDQIPADQIGMALALLGDLLENPLPASLLHGDLHHGNILDAGSRWMLIDPKGLTAEPAFEVGPWFYNPIGINTRDDLASRFTERLDIFSSILGIDRLRLWMCAVVASVLSDCWTLEDGDRSVCHADTVTAALMQQPDRALWLASGESSHA